MRFQLLVQLQSGLNYSKNNFLCCLELLFAAFLTGSYTSSAKIYCAFDVLMDKPVHRIIILK
jgi:hypothetical protein